MTKRLLLNALICIPAFSFAQVTLDNSMTPPVNSMMTYYDANVPSPPFVFSTSGTMNTWDFSGMFASPTDEDTLFIVDPASIMLSSAFPTATHATYENGDDSYSMMKIDGTGITFLGNVSDLTGSGGYRALVAHPELLAMPFPYSYGSTAIASGYFELFETGAFIGEPTIDSVHYKSTIGGQRDVTASGDIIIPSGTFPAILERSINYNVDTLWVKGVSTGNQWMLSPGFPQSSTDSSFYWYTNNSNQPYAHALYDDTGLHDVNFFKDLITNVAGPNRTFSSAVYPNPSNGILNVTLPASTGVCNFSIFDAKGQLVAKGSLNMNQLNISTLPSGFYSIQLTAADGATTTTKFMKQ